MVSRSACCQLQIKWKLKWLKLGGGITGDVTKTGKFCMVPQSEQLDSAAHALFDKSKSVWSRHVSLEDT